MNLTVAHNRFMKSERLCSKKHIDLLFKNGKSKWNNSLRVTWIFCDDEIEAPMQVLFLVPKKQFRRAVDRNLLKRRMREIYRLNKHDLFKKVNTDNKYLLIAFIYVGKTIEGYSVIESDLKKSLIKILKSLN